ncbi:SubName: Full=Uncharacterized protein {ECO:0000313/EMBL:CCA69197.1} [Serendipita indica DSM 11827]|nr:SubName: Full=Uncharacterized protein {ECO:0000313/EMBL:CCA69197.1} [Serendipita indica DSM 11827]
MSTIGEYIRDTVEERPVGPTILAPSSGHVDASTRSEDDSMSLCSNNSNDVENAMDISYNVPFPGPTSLDMDVDMDVDAMSIVTDLEDNSNSMVIEGEVSLPPQIGGRGINGDEVAPDIISPLTPILSLIPSTPSDDASGIDEEERRIRAVEDTVDRIGSTLERVTNRITALEEQLARDSPNVQD